MVDAATDDEPALRVSYFFDVDVPASAATSIQILNTCRALCDDGVQVTAYLGRLGAPVAATLAHYGLSEHPRLRLVPLYTRRRGPLLSAAFVRAMLDRGPRAGRQRGRHAIVSRGETGLALFSLLRKLPKHRTERFVYEAHRTCFGQVRRFFASRLSVATEARIALRTLRVRREEARTVHAVDGLLYLNEEVERALAAAFAPAAPGLVLPSGTSLPASLPADEERDLDVLYAGKLLRRKGIHDLVEALVHLPGRRLTIVGGRPEQIAEIRELAASLDVSERVDLIGTVPPSEVDAYYRRARVGVCPLPAGENEISERFTSPLKVVKMMAWGVPIVGTDLPSLRLLLEHETSGLLVEPSRPRALADGIARLLDDRSLALRLSGTARRDATRYSWQTRARRMRDFIAELP